MYYKLLHRIVSLDKSVFFKIPPNSHGTRDHDYRIIKDPYVNYVIDNCLFSTRCVDDLSSEFVNFDSASSFKKKIDCFNLNSYSSLGSSQLILVSSNPMISFSSLISFSLCSSLEFCFPSCV